MESPPRKLPPKKDVLDAFLSTGSARIFLDPRRTGAIVPKWFAKQAELVLRVGYTLSPPIPDLVVSDEAVSCTLSFNRSPFWCKMPWNAVFAVVSDVDGRGVVWPEDVPLESQLLKPARPKPKLASVSAPKEDAGSEGRGATTESGAAADEESAAQSTPTSSGPTPAGLQMSLRDVSAPLSPVAVASAAASTGEKDAERKGDEAAASTRPDSAVTADARPDSVRPEGVQAEKVRPEGARSEGASGDADSSGSVEPTDSGTADSADGGKKRKRPLPPYLRVVK